MITAEYIAKLVTQALSEDVANGDITAELIGADVQASGRIVTRKTGSCAGPPSRWKPFNRLTPAVMWNGLPRMAIRSRLTASFAP